MDLGLTGHAALVTGATRGIGAATAQVLAEEGANVALVARTQDDLERTASALRDGYGVEVVTVPADLRDSSACRAAVASAVESLGVLDIVANIAGDAPAGRLEELRDEEWEAAFSLKFLGTVAVTRAALPHLRASPAGSVVNIAGVAGWQPQPHQVALGAVNAAIINLSRALARDVARGRVRVNVVVPGPTRTGRWDDLVASLARSKGLSPEVAESIALEEVPDGRPASPAEVARAIAFLASPTSSHINGVALEVDGGEVRGLH